MTGTPRGWLYIEERYWHDRATLGVGCVRHLVELVDRPRWSFGFGHLNLWMAALGLVVALIGAVLLVRARLPTAVTLYGLGALAFAASSANVGVRPRMVLVAFPLIIGIALATRGRAFRWLLALSALGLVAMTVMSMATYAAFP
jgi:hypothetical protein